MISIRVCSGKSVAIQLAVKARKAELDAAGFTGYWTAPLKELDDRQYLAAEKVAQVSTI